MDREKIPPNFDHQVRVFREVQRRGCERIQICLMQDHTTSKLTRVARVLLSLEILLPGPFLSRKEGFCPKMLPPLDH